MYEYLSMLFAINYNFIFNLLRIHFLLKAKLLPQKVWPGTAKKMYCTVLPTCWWFSVRQSITIWRISCLQIYASVCLYTSVCRC